MTEALELTARPQSPGEEIANGISHGIALLAALAAVPFIPKKKPRAEKVPPEVLWPTHGACQRICSSTRRFLARPSRVALLAMG